MEPKLSSRAQKAIQVMRTGGYFRRALEPYYKGGEKFKTWLYNANRTRHPGVGYQTWQELIGYGIIASRYCAPSSTWPEEWSLDPIWAKYNPGE